MPRFEHRFEVDAPIERVRAFHASPEALKVLTPPGAALRLERFGRLEDGMEAEFRLWLGPFPIRWVARHCDVSEDGFTDVQAEGPLAHWTHRHRFESRGPSRSAVIDVIDYAHRPGVRSAWTRIVFGRPALSFLFSHRARATRRAVGAAQKLP